MTNKREAPVHHATPTERQILLRVMSRHVGALNGIPAKQLAITTGLDERRLRITVSDLREEGYAICAIPGTGYYMATTDEELGTCCQFLHQRAMHSLRLEARLRKLALPDLLEQLRFVEV